MPKATVTSKGQIRASALRTSLGMVISFLVEDDPVQCRRAKALLRAGCESVATFDRALLREAGFVGP